MNGSDSNFKIKVSRSLTDLQNSLDEACRLGLPPNLGDQIHDVSENYLCEGLAYNMRNDLTYKCASSNLERFIAMHEQQYRFNEFDKKSRGEQPIGTNNNSLVDNRLAYIETLRVLAENKPAVARSQSYEALNEPIKFPSANRSVGKNRIDRMTIRQKEALESEIRMLKEKLEGMDEEMERMRNGMVYKNMESARSGDLRSFMNGLDIDQEPYEDLKRRLDVYKQREVELLNQLNEAISTAEDAKLEEMQAMVRVEQMKEDIDNMQIRFKEVLKENQMKKQNESILEDQYLHESVMRLKNEVVTVTEHLNLKIASVITLEEQLQASKCEIENLHVQLKTLHQEKCDQTSDLSTSVTMAHLQREEAVNHSSKLQSILDRERCNHSQEKSIMQEEINELKNRLSASENCHLNLSKDKMNLLNEQSEMKAEIMKLMQLKKMEQNRLGVEFKSISKKQEERIKALQNESLRKQEFYERMMNDAEIAMKQQIILINKLKQEYGSNVHDMDGFVDRHREEVGCLQAKLEQYSEELNISKTQTRELQQALDDYNSTIETMRNSCRNLEQAKDKQDEEIICHLSRQNDLMKTIELLTMQIQALRRRIPDCNCGAFDAMDSESETKLFENLLNIGKK